VDLRHPVAILLSCHGTVERADQLTEFVANIRRGRPAPAEVVDEVRRRFEQIGGSPLMRVTHAQAAELERRLEVPVRAAARLWHPYPAEVMPGLIEAGATTIVSLPMAPQSVHVYHDHVRQQLADSPAQIRCVEPWGTEPAIVEAYLEAIDEAVARIDAPRERVAVILSAHSLPQRIIDAGDPYERQFREMADAVAEGLDAGIHRVAFQSQGMGGGQWLGPDLESVMKEVRVAGFEHLVVAPIGFVAEHVETLYDIDIEARAAANALGFRSFERMPAMDTRSSFMDALATVARRYLEPR
jgi:ferrochelatase